LDCELSSSWGLFFWLRRRKINPKNSLRPSALCGFKQKVIINMKKNKNKLAFLLLSTVFLLMPAFSFAALAPTEQAQEQGMSGLQPEGFNQNIRNAGASVDERGLVPCTLSECTFCHLLQLLERIFFWLLSLAFAVAVFFVVVSGFAYILSVGDQGMMGWAKEGLKYSLMGFMICILSWLGIHIVYTVLGYEGNWWKMDCASQQSTSLESQTAASLYANEITPNSFGGRNNPVALSDLTKTGLINFPENKFFFIHGIGGQPLESAAKQIAKITQEAEEQKKVVYAVVPYRDKNGIIVGSQKIKLNDYLPAELGDIISQVGGKEIASGSQGTASKTKDQFYSLMMDVLTKSVTDIIPLVMTKEGITPADFNQMWPKVDWNKALADNSLLFKPSSSVVSGLNYQEGDGPVFYDPDRYGGLIPKNDTHVEVNFKPDGTLDLDNPITIKQVADGVEEEQLNAYIGELGKALANLEKQYELKGNEKDIILGLTKLMAGEQGDAEENGTEKTDKDTSVKNNTEISNEFQQNLDLESVWNTGGAGILPNRIATSNKHPDEIKLDKAIKQLEKEVADFLKNPDRDTGGGITGSNGSTSGGDRSTTGGTASTGDTSSTTSTTGASEPTGNWSGTSIGIKGQLSKDEIKRLEEEIVPKALKDLNLNVPVDFIMCIINKESSFNPSSSNTRGERSLGLTQINTKPGVHTEVDALKGLKSYVNNNDPNNIYMKLRRDVGSDDVLKSDAGLLSQRDPANERGITSVSMGIGYLKLLNAAHKRGNGLKNYSDLENLAGGYNGGPRGSGSTEYTRTVVNCTKTMQNKRNANGGQSVWAQSTGGKKK